MYFLYTFRDITKIAKFLVKLSNFLDKQDANDSLNAGKSSKDIFKTWSTDIDTETRR